MTLTVSRVIMENFWPTLLLSCRHLSMHNSLKVPPQHFSQLQVWTLDQRLYFFTFSDSVVNLPLCLGSLLHHSLLAKHGRWPHIRLYKYCGTQRILCQFNDCIIPRACGCQQNLNHHPSINVLSGGMRCFFFVLICCVWLSQMWPNILISSVKRSLLQKSCSLFLV